MHPIFSESMYFLHSMIKVCRIPLRAAVVLAATSVASIMFSSPELQSAGNPTKLDARNQPTRILSAFFGLDNALNILCPGAARQDGMPVVLSHTVDPDTLQPEDFRVFTRSGSERTPHCSTLRPTIQASSEPSSSSVNSAMPTTTRPRRCWSSMNYSRTAGRVLQ